MIKAVKFFSLSLLSFLISLLIIIPVSAMPPMPSSFYGMVKAYGNNVPDGTLVEAVINGQVYTRGYTQTYQGASVYTLDITGDDPDTTTREGGRDGETIQFMVGGVQADETGIWKSATNVNLNLNVTVAKGGLSEPQATPSPVPTQTAITIIQSSPVPTQTTATIIQTSQLPAAAIVPTGTIASQIQVSSVPTQTPIVQIQSSSIPATPVQVTKISALPNTNKPSSIPTEIIPLSTPSKETENNSSNGGMIMAVVTIASLAIGSVFFSMRRKIKISAKSNK